MKKGRFLPGPAPCSEPANSVRPGTASHGNWWRSKVKKALLEHFYRFPEKYISGEKLSRHLQCTRAAVWKTIEELRKEGYRIEAVPNRGYRLLGAPDKLFPHELQARLSCRWIGSRVYYYETLASTQQLAYELAKDGAPSGTVVIAEQQTGGRGRLGRPWHSPPGTGIWLSLLLRPTVALAHLSQLTLVTAVALVDAIRAGFRPDDRLSPEAVRIKWPNDIYVLQNGGRKKICGILTEVHAEMDRVHTCVIGIGLNVNQAAEDFPPEIRDKATSLALATGRRWHRVSLAARILEQFEIWYETFVQQGFSAVREAWQERALPIGTPIQVQFLGQRMEGTYDGLTAEGALRFRGPDGQVLTVHSGDVDL